jgi:hypothetical protein
MPLKNRAAMLLELSIQADARRCTVSAHTLLDFIRRADLSGDVEFGARAREALINCRECHQGRLDLAIAAYAWCLARFDETPALFSPPLSFLWKYKWIVERAVHFPRIGRTQLLGLLDDMERRYAREGYSLRPVHKYRCLTRALMGDADAERDWYLWTTTPRGEADDCAACDLNDRVQYRLVRGEDPVAFEDARPLLSGSVKCRSVPQITYLRLLVPMWKAGRREEAARLCRLAESMIQGDPEFLRDLAPCIVVQALAGDFERAAETARRAASSLADIHDPLFHLEFCSAALLLLDLAARWAPASTTALAAASLSPAAPAVEPSAAALGPALRDRRQTLAREFDDRNGNGFVSSLVEKADALKSLFAGARS